MHCSCLNCASLPKKKKKSPSPNSITCEYDLFFKNNVFADIIKLRISRRGHTGFGMGLTPVTGVLILGRYKGEGLVNTKAEIGRMSL